MRLVASFQSSCTNAESEPSRTRLIELVEPGTRVGIEAELRFGISLVGGEVKNTVELELRPVIDAGGFVIGASAGHVAADFQVVRSPGKRGHVAPLEIVLHKRVRAPSV